MRTLTAAQAREVERLAEAEKVGEYDVGKLHAYLRATTDPTERSRIEAALDRHDKNRRVQA